MTERREIERAVIGTALYDPTRARQLARSLRVTYFSDPLCRRIFGEMASLLDDGREPSRENISLGFAGRDLVSLNEIEVTVGAFDAGLIARKLVEAVMIDAARGLRAKINQVSDPFELIGLAQEFISEASALISPLQRPSKLDSLEAYQEYLQQNARVGVERIATGFPTLDRMLLGGLTPGNLSLLGGLPGSGKTSFALQVAINAARTGVKVVFLEGEMPSREVYERANGILTGENIDEIRSGVRFELLSRKAIAELYELPLSVVEVTNRDPFSIQSEIQAAASEGAKLLILDYLQVFSGRGKEPSEDYHRVKVFSESLRQIALKCKIHLLVLSSLNRNEQRDSLSINSFYGSSGLGHDASTAILLTGDQKDASEMISGERSVVLKVVKNRSGARGEVNLRYLLKSQCLREAFTGPPCASPVSSLDTNEHQSADRPSQDRASGKGHRSLESCSIQEDCLTSES